MAATPNGKFSQTIERLAQQLRESNARIKQLEAVIAKERTKKKELEETTIPAVMDEQMLPGVTLADGTKISVRANYHATLFKAMIDGKERIDPNKAHVFYEWLEANGYGGLVKQSFTVWTKNIVDINALKIICDEYHLDYEIITKNIHPKTLEAWLKEQTEAGNNISGADQMYNHYIGRKAWMR